jgi:O-antigen/teichoic acid export membrane protein
MVYSLIGQKIYNKMMFPLLKRIKNSPTGQRIAGGLFWSMAGSVTSKMFGLIAIVLAARILEVKVFGEFELVRSTANMLIVFSAFGMGTTATKYISEFLVTDKERVGRILGMNYLFTIFSGILFALLFYIFTPFLCEYVAKVPHLVNEMRFGAILLILVTFMRLQSGILAGFQDFRGLAYTEIIIGTLKIPLLVGGAYYGGLIGILIGFTVSLMFNIVLNYWFIVKNIRKNVIRNIFRNVFQELSILWKFSIPSTLAGVISMPALWFCGVLLVRQENGLTEFGIFNAALQINMILMYLPTLLVQIIIPMLSESYASKNYKRFRKIALFNLVLNITVVTLVSIPLCIFSRSIMTLYGSGFADGGMVLIVLCAVAIAAAPDWVLSQVLTSQGRIWSIFGLNIVWTIALLSITSLFLFLGYGGVALALGHLAAYVFRMVSALLCYYFTTNKIATNKN